MSMLEIKGLKKSFGGLKALGGVDFQVNEGEIVSVIGPNGAGKTTFFNTITGFVKPDEGTILFEGEDIAGWEPNEITQVGIARTFQNVRLFPNMTVLENVMVGQHCRTKQGIFGALFNTRAFREEEATIEAKSKEILSFFGKRLEGYRYNQPAFVLSYANRRRLEIARAMASEPTLLCLDEPTAGMNPKETSELKELIRDLREHRGFTIVVIEHDMKVVRDISDRVVVLDHGVQIASGSYDEVSSNDDVIEAYLGRPTDSAEATS